MFKFGSFETELAQSMEKSLINNQIEKKHSFDKVVKAADCINLAAELLDSSGLKKEADELTQILVSLADDKEIPEVFVVEPLEEKFDFTSEEYPTDVDHKLEEIIEEPEYLEFKSLAEKLSAKWIKKKV